MKKTKAFDLESEITRIINTTYPAGNYSVIDNISSNLVMMTLKSFLNGKHPVLNRRDFNTDVLPVPNMTILDHRTGNYSGVRFNDNCSIALDLFSINKNIDSRNFISVEELKRMKLGDIVKSEDQICIIVKNQWADNKSHHNGASEGLAVIRVVNTESLLKSPKNSKGPLSKRDFNLYFPDFDKQAIIYQNYSDKYRESIQKNIDGTLNIDYPKKQIATVTRNSYLPRLSAEMANYQFCRLASGNYVPKFTREEHLTDIIRLHRQNGDFLKSAIKQGYQMASSTINQLLGNKKAVSLSKTVEQQQKVKVHERKL